MVDEVVRAVGGAVSSRRTSLKTADLADLSLEELELLLEEEKEYNRALPDKAALAEFFKGLSHEELLAFVAELQARLENETELLDRFTRLGLDPFAPDLLCVPLPFPLEVHAPGEVPVASRAFFQDGTIHLNSTLPTLRERLVLLASRGIISNDLFHEVFHGLQEGITLYSSVEDVIADVVGEGKGEARKALAEAHAWLCCLPGFRHDVLIKAISASYKIDDERQLEEAFDLLYSLSVLGLSDEEIGSLVGCASWCEQHETYKELAKERERIMAEAGITEADLERAMERRQLIERLQGVRAMGIARELVQQYSQQASVLREPSARMALA